MTFKGCYNKSATQSKDTTVYPFFGKHAFDCFKTSNDKWKSNSRHCY